MNCSRVASFSAATLLLACASSPGANEARGDAVEPSSPANPAAEPAVDAPTPQAAVDAPTPQAVAEAPTPQAVTEAPTPQAVVETPTPQVALPSTDDELIAGDADEAVTAPSPAEACVSENAAAELEPVVLAFAFDVSGSMGKGDEPYHDRTLKWDPVVAATKAFFADAASAGLSASLTFFPIDSDDKCDAESYLEPVVPLTALPAALFGEAIDDATPQDEDDWIGGTPTRAVLEGTYRFVQQSLANNPEALHAVVLVTDGHPQGCDDDEDDLDAVAEFIGSTAEIAKTYVIGVANPVTEEEPDPPDVVTGLQQLAEAGGTGSAFLIDTGDAEQTAADFAASVAAIRGNSLSCTLTIPAPPMGQTLDTELVNVTYRGASGGVALVYSEDCALQDAWRYDDPSAPTTIHLCDSTCTTVLGDASANVEVEFGCVRRTTPLEAR